MRFRFSLKVAAIATTAGAAMGGQADAQYIPGATEYAPPPPSYVVPAEGSVPPGYGAQVYAPAPVYGPGPAYGPPPAYDSAPGYAPPPPAPGGAAMMSPGQARSIALNLGYYQVGQPVLQGSTYMMTANIESGPVLLGVNAYTGRVQPLGPAYRPPGSYGPAYPAPQRSVSRPPASAPLPAPRPADANVIDADDVPDAGDDVSAPPPPGATVSGAPDSPPPQAAPPPQAQTQTGSGTVTPGDNVPAGSPSVLSRGAQ